MEAGAYSSIETLRDGREAVIRALRPDDREGLLSAVRHISDQALYRRFFGIKREFSASEIDFFLNIDFRNHVALVAVMRDGETSLIVGGGRYIVSSPGVAELAFAVVDSYQGLGLGSALIRHLIALARDAGLTEFEADVLADNSAMLAVFRKSGLRMETNTYAGVVHARLFL